MIKVMDSFHYEAQLLQASTSKGKMLYDRSDKIMTNYTEWQGIKNSCTYDFSPSEVMMI